MYPAYSDVAKLPTTQNVDIMLVTAAAFDLLPRIPMHRNLPRPLPASLLLAGLCASGAAAQSTGPLHPLDGLTTAEYWAAYDVLQQAGHAEPDTFFASVLLRAPPKDLVLSWTEGM